MNGACKVGLGYRFICSVLVRWGVFAGTICEMENDYIYIIFNLVVMKTLKTYLIWGMVVIALIIAAFVYYSVKVAEPHPESVEQVQEKPEGLVGNDQDEHGCIASAGYTWSELLQECIRPFEKGIKLPGVDSDDAIYAAYLVFNENQSQVEVFLPKEEKHPILNKDVIGVDEEVWVSSEEDSPVVKKMDGKWTILFGETISFVEE